MKRLLYENNKKRNITIADVAKALGVSQTTVSRAISGKGRISSETRERVHNYIIENGYRPNVIAKGLAQSKAYNIAFVLPENCSLMDTPFFQSSLLGVCEAAALKGYDVIVTTIVNEDLSKLERLMSNNKADGVILSRTLLEDKALGYLKSRSIPFATLGTSLEKDVIQVDNNHLEACKRLTSILLEEGLYPIGLIGGNSSHMVTRTRYEGFTTAFREMELPLCEDFVVLDAIDTISIEKAVDDFMDKKAQCIICMDDTICNCVLNKLEKEQVKIPKQMKVASFYNSSLLENRTPSITSLSFDGKQLGLVACNTLIDYLEGQEVQEKTTLHYQIVLGDSTKK